MFQKTESDTESEHILISRGFDLTQITSDYIQLLLAAFFFFCRDIGSVANIRPTHTYMHAHTRARTHTHTNT
jgi:hypothetical protein